ncbi:hypothetical protein P9112_000498 [Eukaryota sp. TZLM1-RC]
MPKRIINGEIVDVADDEPSPESRPFPRPVASQPLPNVRSTQQPAPAPSDLLVSLLQALSLRFGNIQIDGRFVVVALILVGLLVGKRPAFALLIAILAINTLRSGSYRPSPEGRRSMGTIGSLPKPRGG